MEPEDGGRDRSRTNQPGGADGAFGFTDDETEDDVVGVEAGQGCAGRELCGGDRRARS